MISLYVEISQQLLRSCKFLQRIASYVQCRRIFKIHRFNYLSCTLHSYMVINNYWLWC